MTRKPFYLPRRIQWRIVIKSDLVKKKFSISQDWYAENLVTQNLIWIIILKQQHILLYVNRKDLICNAEFKSENFLLSPKVIGDLVWNLIFETW